MSEPMISIPDGTSEMSAVSKTLDDNSTSLTKWQSIVGGVVIAASTMAGPSSARVPNDQSRSYSNNIDLSRCSDPSQSSPGTNIPEYLANETGSQITHSTVNQNGCDSVIQQDQFDIEIDTVVPCDLEEEFIVDLEITEIDTKPFPPITLPFEDEISD